MINMPNNVYKIRYDFDLNGATINLPANTLFSYSGIIYKIVGDIDLDGGTLTIATGSTLDFQGGSFNNGTIVGNNTKINAGLCKIFDTTIVLGGSIEYTSYLKLIIHYK